MNANLTSKRTAINNNMIVSPWDSYDNLITEALESGCYPVIAKKVHGESEWQSIMIVMTEEQVKDIFFPKKRSGRISTLFSRDNAQYCTALRFFDDFPAKDYISVYRAVNSLDGKRMAGIREVKWIDFDTKLLKVYVEQLGKELEEEEEEWGEEWDEESMKESAEKSYQVVPIVSFNDGERLLCPVDWYEDYSDMQDIKDIDAAKWRIFIR